MKMTTVSLVYVHVHICSHFFPQPSPPIHIPCGLGESWLLADFLLMKSGYTCFIVHWRLSSDGDKLRAWGYQENVISSLNGEALKQSSRFTNKLWMCQIWQRETFTLMPEALTLESLEHCVLLSSISYRFQ